MRKLDIFPIAGESLISPFIYRSRVAKVFGPVFVFHLIVAGIQVMNMRDDFGAGVIDPASLERAAAEFSSWNWMFFMAIVAIVAIALPQLLFTVAACVRWQRLLVLGPRATAADGVFSFRGREVGYLGRALQLVLLYFGLFLIVAIGIVFMAGAMGVASGGELEWGFIALMFLVYLVATTVVSYVMIRFSLILPARAIDHPITLGQAWRITGGNGLRLLAATFIANLALAIAYGVFSVLVLSLDLNALISLNPIALTATALLMAVLSTHYIALFAGLPALAFRDLALGADGRPAPDPGEVLD